MKIISRSDGRSATAAAAYRAGARIECEREGRTHDYTRKNGVEATFIHAPESAPAWVKDRAALWNRAEQSETRKNSRVAREWELALPAELSPEKRQQLASDYARALVDRYGAAVDVAIHAPHREGDSRNHHAHVMMTTRKIGPDGFGEKTRELDDRKTGPQEIEQTRDLWAQMQNCELEKVGTSERVDHRSLAEQRADAMERGQLDEAASLDRAPEVHMGPEVAAIERREQCQAEQENRPYEPVTERGQIVHEVRKARTILARLSAARDAIKDRWQQITTPDHEGRRQGFIARLKDQLKPRTDVIPAATKKDEAMTEPEIKRAALLRGSGTPKPTPREPLTRAELRAMTRQQRNEERQREARDRYERRKEQARDSVASVRYPFVVEKTQQEGRFVRTHDFDERDDIINGLRNEDGSLREQERDGKDDRDAAMERMAERKSNEHETTFDPEQALNPDRNRVENEKRELENNHDRSDTLGSDRDR